MHIYKHEPGDSRVSATTTTVPPEIYRPMMFQLPQARRSQRIRASSAGLYRRAQRRSARHEQRGSSTGVRHNNDRSLPRLYAAVAFFDASTLHSRRVYCRGTGESRSAARCRCCAAETLAGSVYSIFIISNGEARV